MTRVSTAFAALIASGLALGPALAQEGGGDAAQAGALTLTCAELVALEGEAGVGAIHYMAGYSDGQRDMLAASGPAESEAGSEESGVSGGTAEASPGAAAGLGISVDQVLAACADAPDSPASEVIKVARGAVQPEVDAVDDDPAAEGEDGQDVGSGNSVVE